MTKHFQTLVVILLLAVFSACTAEQHEQQINSDKWTEKTYPYEDFHLQRSYPDKHFNIKAYEKAMRNARQQELSKNVGFDSEWTIQGPGNIGARANTIAVHPQNEDIVFTGYSSGGAWRTTNGGADWEPVFDDQLWPSIGDIAFDPSNPETVYIGTGDPNISFYPMLGDGVYKSTDGGDSWTNIGLEEQRVIPEIIIHPNNPNILFAASMGLPFVRGQNRGLYRTKNGGNNWEQVLFISDSTGVIDIEMDPFNPDVMYASGWDRVRNNEVSLTTGEGAKIFKTTDGGDNWNQLTGGLPSQILGRTGLAISALTPGLVYAMYVGTNQQLFGIFKSENAGNNWTLVETNGLETALGGFGWYFGKLRTSPSNDDELFVLGVNLWRGFPEFGFWEPATPEWWTYQVHADKHDLVFGQSGNMYLATDGGLYKSTDKAISWTDIENIPTTQFYRVAYNPHQPGWYYGGAQDNGTTGGNANNINGWPRIYGGDGFKPVFHPFFPDIFYCETQRGNIVVTTNGGYSFSPADNGIDNDDRRDWDMPYLMSAHNPDVFYAGTFRVYKSENGVEPFFFPISEDLSDGLILASRYHNITTLAESPIQAGLLYAGTVDANVWRTENDGDSWINITGNLPERYVTEVKASPSFEDWVYVTHSGYKDNDFIPRIHRSINKGNDWEDISNNLPNIAINDVYVLPNHADSIIFVATDAGIYATLSGGDDWERLGNNMPYVPSFDIDWNEGQNTLIAGTFARSIMSYPIDSLLASPPPDTTTATRESFVEMEQLNIFPNPVADKINISFPSYEAKKTELVILDKSGKVVHQVKLDHNSASNFQLDVSFFATGEYFIKSKTGHLIRSGRFVKVN